jgi:NAD(P)-dependent dehydrogenase (short-subunit alcohol dehydrogenase family)
MPGVTTLDFGLRGVTVVVTGAATGIGYGIAQGFARQGARVAVVDRDGERLSHAARALREHAEVHAFAADLNDDGAVAELADELAQVMGPVQVLVNNAGTEYPTPIDAREPEAMARWQWLVDNNLHSMVRTTRALLPRMPDGSAIINQASIWGHSAVGGFSAYVATKHAVIGLTRSLAWELAPRRIRVNAVCPGWVKTEASMRSLAAMASQRGVPEQAMLDEILAAQPLPTLLEPADIADVYLFLASNGARAITGQSLVASNGELMH